MRTYRTNTGPVRERPFYPDADVERICSDELRKLGLYPSSPQPINIDLFVEKRFGVTPEPADELPPSILGYTAFGANGVQAIYVSRVLFEDETEPGRKRVTTTLAHEAGHGLLHAHLFAFEADKNLPLFGQDSNVTATKILCRDEDTRPRPGYDGRWWEVQANMAMASLVLPKTLVLECVKQFLQPQGILGGPTLPDSSRESAIRLVADTFDLNPIVAKHRLAKLFPVSGGQLTL